MLRRTMLIAAALIPATAATAAPIVAQQDGFKFEYVSHVEGDKVVLDGRLYDPDQKFTFVVLPNGKVSGTVGTTPVEFTISHTEHDRLMSQVTRGTDELFAEAATK